MVARSLANLRDRREARAQRAAEMADRNTERAGEQRYRDRRDAVSDQRYEQAIVRQDNQTTESNRRQDATAAKDRQRQSIRDNRDERRHDEQIGRQDAALADAREKQRMADIEAGRVAPGSPSPMEMQRADYGTNQRKIAAEAARAQQAQQTFIKINDQALEYAKQADPADQSRAYGDFWTQARRQMPPDVRASMDSIGNGLAMEVPGVAKALRGAQQGASGAMPVGDGQLPPGDGVMAPMRLKSGKANSQPVTRDFKQGGTERTLQWDGAKWVEPELPLTKAERDAEDTAAAKAKEDAKPSWWSQMFGSSPEPDPGTTGASDGFSLTAPTPATDQAAVAQTSNAMRRGAPPAPQAATGRIDMGGVDAWHQLAMTKPDEFKQQLFQLKAAGDPRYDKIVSELRRRQPGPVSPAEASAAPRSIYSADAENRRLL